MRTRWRLTRANPLGLNNEAAVCHMGTDFMNAATTESDASEHVTLHHRFIVIQVGARLDYIAAAIFARHGLLERLYTDVTGNVGLPGVARRLLPQIVLPKLLRRLFGRVVPEEIDRRCLRTLNIGALVTHVLSMLNGDRVRASFLPIEERLRRQLLRDGFGRGTAIYTFLNSDLDLARQAKEAGLAVVHDQYMNPKVGLIMLEEWARFPGLEPQTPLPKIEAGIKLDREKWAVCDLILAPSRFVANEIVELDGPAHRLAVVPYGIDERWLQREPRPERGRILFVGSVGLRKGNHYLAEASRILQRRRFRPRIRVVGPCDPALVAHPEFQGPTYVGQVPRSEVHREFVAADFFALPTLSESFGMVHLEALASGLPVITTPNCGSVVQDGIDGFIVPIRDAEALADRMEQLLTDRHLRDRMAANARRRAAEYSWERYGARLLEKMHRLPDPKTVASRAPVG